MRKNYHSVSEQKTHLEAQRESGMTKKAYCLAHNLNFRTFGNWHQKHKEKKTLGEALPLVPLKKQMPPQPEKTFRICFPSGIFLELASREEAVLTLKDLHRGGGA